MPFLGKKVLNASELEFIKPIFATNSENKAKLFIQKHAKNNFDEIIENVKISKY
mgnify:CR=1 FL=1